MHVYWDVSVTTLIILALAAQRLHFLWLTQAIFGPARAGIGWLSPYLSYVVNCPVCTSVWAGVIVYVLFRISWLGELIDYALALSVAISMINTVVSMGEAKIAHLMRPQS